MNYTAETRPDTYKTSLVKIARDMSPNTRSQTRNTIHCL